MKQCPDCCGSGQGTRSIEWVAGRAHVEHERCQTCGGHGEIDDRTASESEIPGFDPDYRSTWRGNADLVRSVYGSQVKSEMHGDLLVLIINDKAYAFDAAATQALLTVIRNTAVVGPTGRELSPHEAAART